MTSKHRTSAFVGAIFSVGMRWTDRLIGLVSTLVLARLLAPDDFGLVAMAMVVVGLVDVLLDLGVVAALIQNRDATDDDFNTAWSLRLVQAIAASAIVGFGAPLAAQYYGDPRVVDVMRVIALTLLVGGLENIGIVRFQKDMEFGRDFNFFLARRLIGTVITLSLAFALRSYWALVLGALATRGIGVGLSYVMHGFRPRFSFAKLAALWSFSQWSIVLSTTQYLNNRLDQIAVGRRTNAATLGAYSVGDELASLPTTELLAPLGRVMFPSFVNARHDFEEFRRVVHLSFSIQALVGIPACVGMALVASELVPLLLGEKWHAAIPFVQTLGFVGVVTSLTNSAHYALLALGRVRALSLYNVARFLLFGAALLFAFPRASPASIAELRLIVAALALIGMQVLLRSELPAIRPLAMLRGAWRSAAGAVVMVPIVIGAATLVPDGQTTVVLVVKVVTGVLSYCAACALLWLAAGRPPGAEAYLVEQLRARMHGGRRLSD